MSATRLLERIREMERNPDWRGDVDPVSLQESILNHLKVMLNTRQGSAIIAGNFGVPDFSELTSSFSPSEIPRIERSLCEVISRYERRLTNIAVHFRMDAKDPSNMSFVLEGELVGTRDPHAVRFETVLSSSGQITVNRYNEAE